MIDINKAIEVSKKEVPNMVPLSWADFGKWYDVVMVKEKTGPDSEKGLDVFVDKQTGVSKIVGSGELIDYLLELSSPPKYNEI